MPELPDISVYINALKSRIVGKSIRSLTLNSPFLLRTAIPDIKELTGTKNSTVLGLSRMGKRLVFELPEQRFLVLHLMIAGRLQWYEIRKKTPQKTILMKLTFDTGSLTLTEAGSKKRASLHYIDGLSNLDSLNPKGLEIHECTLAEFTTRLCLKNHTLKRAITSPQILSGIGNAYSDEILHQAKLSPVKQTFKMSDQEFERLFDATVLVLKRATDTLMRETGEGFPKKVTAFRDDMAVHGKYQQPCPVCGTSIQRIRYVSNETNYCPRCQTGGKILADRSLSRLLKGDWPKTIEALENQQAYTSKK